MFMRENRKKNGAPQPEATASGDSGNQKAARQLAPNGDIPDGPQDLRFSPNMDNPASINEAHYQGGVSGSGPFKQSYEDKILHVGTKPYPTGGGRDLKSR